MRLIDRCMRAEDAIEEKSRFPLGIQPKIDGVRALHCAGQFTGRTLKPFGNRYTQGFFNDLKYLGLDGELAAESETHPALCRLTTSAVNSHEGQPFVLWWLFDYIGGDNKSRPYLERYYNLRARVLEINCPRLRVVPMHVVNSLAELHEHEEHWLRRGFEGVITRNLDGMYKEGRSTVREGGLLRLKRFIEEEMIVERLEEAMENTNEQTINEQGLSERSSHQAGMVPKGMVGPIHGRDKKTGKSITIGPGEMSHADRIRYWNDPSLLVGKEVKYKHFPKGVKNKPRFPTFVCVVGESDLEAA